MLLLLLQAFSKFPFKGMFHQALDKIVSQFVKIVLHNCLGSSSSISRDIELSKPQDVNADQVAKKLR